MSPLFVVYSYLLLISIWFILPNHIFISLGIEKSYEKEMIVYLIFFLFAWTLGYMIASVMYCTVKKNGAMRNVKINYSFLIRLSFIFLSVGSLGYFLGILRMIDAIGFNTFIHSNGFFHIQAFDSYGKLKGITTLSQLIPAGFIILTYCLIKEKFKISTTGKLLILFASIITLYRGLYMARTALLEVLLPIFVIYINGNREKVNFKNLILLFFSLLILYIVGDLARSYQAIPTARNYNVYEWGLLRLGQYIATVFYYFFHLSSLEFDAMYGINLFRWVNRIFESIYNAPLTNGVNGYFALSESSYKVTGFSTLTVAGDYYIDSKYVGILYAFLQSFLYTLVYKSYLSNNTFGNLLYPIIFVSCFLMWYVVYINTTSGLLIFLAIFFAYAISSTRIYFPKNNSFGDGL
jgi:oligosaccharide repeat unit polymerase